jgi:hypothetical protein
MPSVELLGLPHNPIVDFRSPSHSFHALVDHARYYAGEWQLRLPHGATEKDRIRELEKTAKRDRRESGFEPRRTIISGRAK